MLHMPILIPDPIGVVVDMPISSRLPINMVDKFLNRHRTVSHNISPYISANTRIRFMTSSTLGNNDLI